MKGKETNRLYICQETNDIARVRLTCDWRPAGAYSNRCRWAIRTVADGEEPEWDAPRKAAFTAQPSAQLVWHTANAQGGVNNRQFLMCAWFDCDDNGLFDPEEPHRMIGVTILSLDLNAAYSDQISGRGCNALSR